MARTVEYCLNNVAAATRSRLADTDHENVVGKRCLQRCGECYRGKFLVIDGELVPVNAHEDALADLVGVDE